ncbi:glycosyltransferase [Micromonospora coxensis]|uniref:Glycosyltransferase involved in cell wall bisynthesis n=1 Tax=Micromonospora coxensis TaxID=356852 RepID=A0A1C5JEK7_9ACTN|nr:glycosyltransferase [Micromonospora coxensis]SCG68629.1 Glycosyltransferase involved in cell wall bisynthesis [Micromonospora coxensis]
MDAPGRPLRVAYVLLRPPSYSETFITSEIEAVRAAGATVEVFVARRDGGRGAELRQVLGALLRHPVRTLAGVRVLGMSYLPRALLAAAHAARLSGPVSRFGADVLHAHFVNLPTAVAALVGRWTAVPVTAMAHAADFLLDGNGPALDRRLRLLSHLFVISRAAATQLAERGATVSEIPHSVVRAAFDGEIVEPQGRPTGSTIRLVTVARLVEKKGVDTALDAVALLVRAGIPVRYDIYGDGPIRSVLADRAHASALTDVVTFHGAVSHRVATAALVGADAAVLPCRRAADGDLDGIPVFLMEAASRGVPVVTTAVSGIPELIGSDGGWQVPPDDPTALADALRQLIHRPEEGRRRAGILARRLREEFSPTLQARRLLTVWGRLVDRAPRSTASRVPFVSTVDGRAPAATDPAAGPAREQVGGTPGEVGTAWT